jgi:hypothetical protein
MIKKTIIKNKEQWLERLFMNFKLSKIEICDAGKGELFEFVEILRNEHKSKCLIHGCYLRLVMTSTRTIQTSLNLWQKIVYYSTKNLEVE